jgi:hypothetical protein
VDPWKKLYREMQRASHRSSERAFDDWCARITAEVMEAIYAESLQRAQAFEIETGSRVTVEYPSRETPDQGVFVNDGQLSFMKFTLGATAIYLYSARRPDKLPSLHIVSASEQLRPSPTGGEGSATAPMRQRLMSSAVARVIEQDGRGYRLCHQDSNQKLGATDLVFLAFERLVTNWRSPPVHDR